MKIFNPRFWLIIFGLANLLFGAMLYYVSEDAAANLASELGSDLSDSVLLLFAENMHEALGVVWAAWGAFTLAAGIRNKGANAKGPAVLAAMIGIVVQVHHSSQIIADELPVGYTDVVISLVLIVFLLISGITYKDKIQS
tara:strand:- start:96861 stop:97280 length:420 start_codon:yes stop_codon:yes gene_type:complete